MGKGRGDVQRTHPDCLLIGYNDMGFPFQKRIALAMGERSAEYSIYSKDHLQIDGQSLPYMDVLNHYRNKVAVSAGKQPDNYYHVGEVSNLASVYLKSFLERRGFSCDFASLYPAELQRIAALLRTHEPLCVAITTTFYVMPEPVVEITQFVRQHNERVPIIVGGPLVSNLSMEMDGETLGYAFDQMGADVFVNEAQGELTLLQILRALRDGATLADIPNLFLPVGDRWTFTGAQPEAQSLDDVAIEWDRFSDDELGVTVQTRTARSCAFKCSFCDYPIRAGALTLASVATVEHELTQLAGRGVKNVVFIDDTFNVPMGRFKELCRMMIRNRFGFEWFSYFRASHARDEEVFDLMHASGCRGVFLGIESGDQQVLTNMHKVASLDQYRYGMEHLHRRGIITFASFIAGFPGETEQSIENTIRFINETAPTFFRIEPWWYNHRSPIYQRREEFALRGHGYRWEHATMRVAEACEATDRLFRDVTGSTWMPMFNFDFWAVPYLLGKGMTPEQLIQFHRLARRVMAYNLDRGPTGDSLVEAYRHACENLEAFCQSLHLSPPRYHTPQAG